MSATKACHLVRTVVADSKEELKPLVRQAAKEGWSRICKPSQLLVGGHPAKGRGSWMQLMEKRTT